MSLKLLDCVVLNIDIPQYNLKKGDVGAVVEIYPPDGYEVEFVTGSGMTQALVTVKYGEIRPFGPKDMLSVRSVNAA